MAQFIRTRTDILAGGARVLHIAPEHGIAAMLRPRTDYVGLDLNPERFIGAIRGDVTALPFKGELDVVVCSHVLEHISNEKDAIASIYATLKPDGLALIEVPTYGETTYEILGLTADQRQSEYGNPDHFRLNGADFAKRLEAAGFVVDVLSPDDLSGEYVDRDVVTPHTESDWLLFVARKPQTFASEVATGDTKETV